MSRLSRFLKDRGIIVGKSHARSDPASAALKSALFDRAVQDSADFVLANIGSALIFDSPQKIRSFAYSQAPKNGLLIEFGVFKGESINSFSRRMRDAGDNRTIYGFDSFEGLEYDWPGTDLMAREAFNAGGAVPDVGANVKLVPGWIDSTLPSFLSQNSEGIAFIHVDTDTYEACKTILELCIPRLSPGAIILFDEMLCLPGWRHGEIKALNEVMQPDRYVWRAFAGERAMLQIR